MPFSSLFPSAAPNRALAAMRAVDWAATPLGPPDGWPQPLKTLVELMVSSNQPMFVAWGPERTFIYNDPYIDILASKHPDAMGRDFLEAWREIRDDLVPIVEEAYAGRPVHMDDIRLLMERKGFPEETHFAFSYTPVRDEAGRVAGFFCACVETTDQVLATDALAELNATLEARVGQAVAERAAADALYRAYFQHSAEALFVIDVGEEGRFAINELNPAHERATGFSTASHRGRDLAELLPPETYDQVVGHYRRAIDTGEVQTYADEFTLNGETRYWDTVLVPVREADGRIARLIGSSRDKTGQVLAENALRQAQKMEAVGQLTGGIAHDFNNLLGAMVGSFDLIRRKPDDVARVKRFAEAGLQAGERGAKLTAQLLAFSRAQRIEMKALRAGDVIRGMEDLLRRTLGHPVRLALDLADDEVAVRTDETQLEMAVLNLAINARDAMPDGGTVTVATARHALCGDPELPDGDYLLLSVRDTGTGMAPEVAARAFDPFFTTKGLGKGTGLGLSQVYGLCRQSGGVARIESRAGQGTTVSILLPLTDAPPAPAIDVDTSAEGSDTIRASVLVVDDDPDVRTVLVSTLRSLGHQVREVENGPAALRAVAGDRPDLAIVDYAMPGMNGAELAGELRARMPGLPILFASGYSDTDAIEKVAGRDTAVLRKPFRAHELQDRIVRILRSGAEEPGP